MEQKRNEEWALVKKQELESAAMKRSDTSKLIWSRAKQFAMEYDDQQKEDKLKVDFILTLKLSSFSLPDQRYNYGPKIKEDSAVFVFLC